MWPKTVVISELCDYLHMTTLSPLFILNNKPRHYNMESISKHL